MTVHDTMSVDAYGLIHGGFVFGLADHAAMLAVNHPNVVLAGAEVRFLAPVRPGEELVADAQVTESNGKKRTVSVAVTRNNEMVFSGIFHCAVLDKHVLEK
jgi:acyl-coenzyme A thioesterase PaaI-like protein